MTPQRPKQFRQTFGKGFNPNATAEELAAEKRAYETRFVRWFHGIKLVNSGKMVREVRYISPRMSQKLQGAILAFCAVALVALLGTNVSLAQAVRDQGYASQRNAQLLYTVADDSRREAETARKSADTAIGAANAALDAALGKPVKEPGEK